MYVREQSEEGKGAGLIQKQNDEDFDRISSEYCPEFETEGLSVEDKNIINDFTNSIAEGQ